MSRTLQRCREAGFQIELDDFGTGYSSLNALGSMPLDVVKLDQSFMRDMTDRRRLRVLEACVSLAQSLGLRTVAEGVETLPQLQLVARVGCDAVQGYYHSRPIPADAFREYLRRCRSGEGSSVIA